MSSKTCISDFELLAPSISLKIKRFYLVAILLCDLDDVLGSAQTERSRSNEVETIFLLWTGTYKEWRVAKRNNFNSRTICFVTIRPKRPTSPSIRTSLANSTVPTLERRSSIWRRPAMARHGRFVVAGLGGFAHYFRREGNGQSSRFLRLRAEAAR